MSRIVPHMNADRAEEIVETVLLCEMGDTGTMHNSRCEFDGCNHVEQLAYAIVLELMFPTKGATG